MTSFASLARLGMLALLCGAAALASSSRVTSDARAEDMGGNGPLPLGPVPVMPAVPPVAVGPAPDCLPKELPPPVLKVKVRVAAFNAPGQPIEYRLCVENCSIAEAHHVLLKNPLPANAKFVRADPGPSLVVPELQWQLGTIGGGACREVVLVLQPTDAADIKNCTRVQFEHGQCVTTRQAAYPPAMPGMLPPTIVPPAGPPLVMPPAATTEPPTVPPVVPVPKITSPDLPKLALSIEGHKRQYVNLASHYFITVTNTGKARATNVLVSCVVPSETKLERARPNYNFVAGQVAWVVGDLEPGAQRTVELVLKAQTEGKICVRPSARADRGVTAEAEACTEFIGVSALHVGMTDRDDPLVVGGKTSYTILLRSQGGAPVTNLKIKAFIPAALQLLDVKGPSQYQLGDKTPQGQWVEMAPLARLDVMTSQTYEIFVEARQAGATRMQVEVGADQLERGPVIEQESTTLFQDDPARP